jgi:hypothetical protein
VGARPRPEEATHRRPPVSASMALATCNGVTCAWPWRRAKLMLLRALAAPRLPLS